MGSMSLAGSHRHLLGENLVTTPVRVNLRQDNIIL